MYPGNSGKPKSKNVVTQKGVIKCDKLVGRSKERYSY